MTDPATALVPTHEDASAPATPFQVVGSDDAGYCVDGTCIIPTYRDAPRAVDGTTQHTDDRGDAQADAGSGE